MFLDDGKSKVLFGNVFEFEFTLVPVSVPSTNDTMCVDNEKCCCASWFILGVSVDSMKEVFKHSLTGIFQFKHNNKNTTDLDYFKNIYLDCLKYIKLVNFFDNLKQSTSEKYKNLLMEFTFKSEVFSFELNLFEEFRLIIKINPLAKKFKFEFIYIGKSFITSNLNYYEINLEKCLLQFDEDQFCDLVIEIKREIFVKVIQDREYEYQDHKYSIINCSEIPSKIGFCVLLRKVPSVAFSINLNKLSSSISINFWSLSLQFQNGFMELKFKEIKNNHSDSDLTNDKDDSQFHLNFSIPNTKIELFKLLVNCEKSLEKLSSKNIFESILNENFKNEIEGIFENEDLEDMKQNIQSFRIFSMGQPRCVENVKILSTSENNFFWGSIKLNLSCGSDFKFETERYEGTELLSLILKLKKIIRILTIWEQFVELDGIEEIKGIGIIKFDPLNLSISIEKDKFKSGDDDEKTKTRDQANNIKNNNIILNLTSTIDHLASDKIKITVKIKDLQQNNLELENFVNSQSKNEIFTIYEFIEKINKFMNNQTTVESSPTTDLEWLSDSFM